MKRILPIFLIVGMYISVALGGYDYTISDTYYYGILTLNNESLLVTGAGANEIDSKGQSSILVINTGSLQNNVGGIYSLDLYNSSSLDYSGGETGGFSIYDNAEATFSGGRIDYIYSYQDSDLKKHITFICDLDSVNLTGNLLTGDWMGYKGSFSITLENQAGYDSVYSNIQFVPEPTTLLLFGLGGLLLRRKK